jgi:hypothetical protein
MNCIPYPILCGWLNREDDMGGECGAYGGGERGAQGVGGETWMELAQDRDGWRELVSTVKKLWVPLNAGNFLVSCED